MIQHQRTTWWERYRLPRPAAWTSIIVRKVVDRPLAHLPAGWRARLQRPWRKWLVVVIETWVYIPWTGFLLGVYRPPERLMTESDRQDGAQAIAIRSMREERDRYWLRPYERWTAVWARAQIAADERARARGDSGDEHVGPD